MIYLIVESDLKEYERKVTEIGRNHNVVYTDFGRIGEFYWIRIDCEN